MKTYDFLNTIFEPLGYIIMPHSSDHDPNTWDLYIKDSEVGLEYFGSFEFEWKDRSHKAIEAYFIVNANKEDLSKEVCYSPKELIDEIKYYNSKLIVPAYCNDPNVRAFGNIERAFKWYMETLGFTRPRWDEYSTCNIGCAHSDVMILKNLYGENISRVTLMIDEFDDTKGSIVRSIGQGWSWVQSDFNGIDEMIASINSILEPEMLINASKQMYAATNMTENRTDNISLNKIDKSMNCYKINAKNALKNALQDALNKLN